MRSLTLLFFFLAGLALQAQYHPALGEPGCIAIHKYSSVFTTWATSV
jgi:hypothetical protein